MTDSALSHKKKLFIHIGAAKTASTTVQSFLFQNKDILAKHGVFFPVVEETHVYKKRPWANARKLSHSLTSFKSRSNAIWQEDYIKPFQHSALDTLIITDELFCFTPASVWDVIDLSEFDIKIIAYIRPSVEYLCSAWSQACRSSFYKNFNGKLTLEEFIEQPYVLPQIFESYIKKFGQENFILRPLEKEQLKDGNVHADILNCLGIEITDEFKIDSDKQLSVNRNLAELLRLINTIDIPLRIHREIKLKLLENFSLEPRVIDTLNDETIQRITDKHREDENNLAKQVLGHDTLFINDYPKVYKKERPAYTHVTWTLDQLKALDRVIHHKLFWQTKFNMLLFKIKYRLADIEMIRKAYQLLKGNKVKS